MQDLEDALRRELRQVADDVAVPPLPRLPAGRPHWPTWVPTLAAAAVVVIALVALAGLLPDRGGAPEPAPQPTEVAPRPTEAATDDAAERAPRAVPTGPPTVPYVLDRVVHVGGRSFPGYDWVDGTRQGWIAVQPPFTWSWSGGGAPEPLDVALEQPPAVSPGGAYLAYLTSEGELNGFETARGGEGMGLSVPVPVRDEDGVGTRIGAVTDEGWVIASGRGVGVLWRPFDGAAPVDLTRTAPGQLVWQATQAGLVVVDGTGDARDPGGGGRVYLADVTAGGEVVPIADLPHFAIADVTEEWVAWVPAEQVGGEVQVYDEIRVRRLQGAAEDVLTPPPGWRFVNSEFTFEDAQFLLTRVSDGQRQRMVRCSPALLECVLLEAP
ncbi:hypothetical protein [Nocardioides perillae]|uniref:Uncharacterized protein n=1 Tax=Nocardioides perillae TaxID=1119534 RepID=A0A7Y9RP47_9ACTN|nr:hypothetical protein [Nocardioides perillae]NYG53740.1 hypothetical protein [Nocardioides perillae]